MDGHRWATRTNQITGIKKSGARAPSQLEITSDTHLTSKTSMSQRVVAVTYNLVLPEGTPQQNIESSTSVTQPVAASASGYKEYYSALRAAIDEVKVVTGHELTVWRDAVGNRELRKDLNTKKEEGDDGDEDAEGEE